MYVHVKITSQEIPALLFIHTIWFESLPVNLVVLLLSVLLLVSSMNMYSIYMQS